MKLSTCRAAGRGVVVAVTLLAAAGAARADVRQALDLANAWGASSAPATEMQLGPALDRQGLRSRAWLAGLFGAAGGEAGYRGARAGAEAQLWRRGALGLDLQLAAADRAAGQIEPRDEYREGLRLGVTGERAGAWGALAAGQVSGGEAASGLPLLGLGAWMRRSGVVLSASLDQTDRVVRHVVQIPDPTPPPMDTLGLARVDVWQSTLVRLTTARLRCRWEGARLALETMGSLALGPTQRGRLYARADATLRLARGLALVAAAGAAGPEPNAIEPDQQSRVSVGLRLSEWPLPRRDLPLAPDAAVCDWRVRPAGDGRYAISLRAPGAHRVEISGDVTEWTAAALEPVKGGRWEIVLPMAPGVHQVNVRVDGGAWRAPPGLPTTSDGYSDAVGVMVVD